MSDVTRAPLVTKQKQRLVKLFAGEREVEDKSNFVTFHTFRASNKGMRTDIPIPCESAFQGYLKNCHRTGKLFRQDPHRLRLANDATQKAKDE